MKYTENRGAEWHKWDLHVHTPASGLNNQFGSDSAASWDEYVKVLFNTAIANEVSVIGVTDYFLIDGYKKIKTEYLSNRQRLLSLFGDDTTVDKVLSIKILPNIEFRLGSIVDGNRINFHIILSDELSIENIEDLFLTQLKIQAAEEVVGVGTSYVCNKRGLEQIGLLIKSQDSSFSGNNYEVGCTVATVERDQIISVLSGNKIFNDKYIFVTPVDEDLCKISWSGQGHLVRKLFYQQSHAFFSSNPKTQEFALGKLHNTPADYLSEFKSFKPCFIGSDSHSIDDIKAKLGQWNLQRADQSRITWIKAEPTFRGLLQTIYEPATRVHIQSSRPEPKTDMHVISSIRYKNSDDTFNSQQKILFNENLNAIIGGKSSGKSLLMSSIAKAVNKENYDDINKVLNISGYDFVNDVEVTWKDGTIDSFINHEPTHAITYIPQLYINFLAEQKNRVELNEFILGLLLQNSNFKNVYDSFLQQISSVDMIINEYLQKIYGYLNESKLLRKTLSETGMPDAIQKSIDTLKAKIKEITDRSTLTEVEKKEYDELIKTIEISNKEYSRLKSCVEFTDKLRELINKRTVSLVGEESQSGEEYIPGEIDELAANYLYLPQEVENVVDTIRGSYLETLRVVNNNIEQLDLPKRLTDRGISHQKLLHALEPYNKKLEGQKDIKKLQEQLNELNIKLNKSNNLKAKIAKSKQDYVANKKALITHLRNRAKQYEELVSIINNTYSEVDSEIKLVAKISVERESLSLYNYVNKQRTTGSHFDAIFPEKGDVNYGMLPDFLENLRTFKDGEISFSDGTKCIVNKDVTITHIFNAVTENEMQLKFDIKYRNDSLHQMSPGKKGTVLLILFLQISSAEYPILIDQPEDNLDNRTIYELLCTMIKRKKSDRQIIIVTHNANLVVGTDSENIIVANQAGQSSDSKSSRSYRFEYVNGPIELSFVNETETNELKRQGIKEHICDILEGGREAFIKREQKYSI